jgi:hypothetical protein
LEYLPARALGWISPSARLTRSARADCLVPHVRLGGRYCGVCSARSRVELLRIADKEIQFLNPSTFAFSM